MEKEQKKKSKKKSTSEETKTPTPTYIFGWNNPDEVANDIWKTSAESLLRGDLVFAYRSGENKGLERLVIVYNFDVDQMTGKKKYTNFGLQMITSSWSCLIPHVTIEYLETILLKDLEDYKVNKLVLENFKTILETLSKYEN